MPKKRPGNQHNHRHENGIVAPGKRITKQKSNGQLNGGAPAAVSSPSPFDPSASAAHATALSPGRQPSKHSTALKNLSDGAIKRGIEVEAAGNGDIGTSIESRQVNGSVLTPVTKSVKIASTDVGRRRENALSVPLTIIRSCPLADTLTILIILLSIPSTILTLINTLFASLTFMPPAGAFFSLPSTLGDIFQGSGGTPSLATVIITDFIGLLIWLVSWTPIQALAIEYTQAVVAATLGGSNSNKKTGHDRTILCMAIVTARHLLSRGWVPARVMGYDWRAILSRIPYIDTNRQFLVTRADRDDLLVESRGGWGWFRILVALHILVQGLVHVARRWYQRREYTQSQSIASSKKSDPETGAHHAARPGPTPLSDSSAAGSSPSTTLKSSIPTVKDVREKASSGKRRRKQAAQVRSQQPLWAAFAATKVTIMREYENGNARHESIQSNAKDPANLGDARFGTEDDRIWVANIQADRFTFLSTYLNSPSKIEPDQDAEDGEVHDFRTPFYIRINETDWTSTVISIADVSDDTYLTWSIVVFGLTPSSSYRCSLVSGEDNVVLSTMTVTTSPSPIEEKDSGSPTAEGPQRAQRPYSPTSPSTTLRKSISGFEANINELLAKQKRLKKENKTATSNIKREIDMLHAKINKLAGEDRSHANRHMQWTQHTKQAEEALAAIDIEIEELDAVPAQELKDFQSKRSEWEEVQARQRAKQDELTKARDDAQRTEAAIQSDIQSARQKKERLQARMAKLTDQLEKLEASGVADPHGKGGGQSQATQKALGQNNLEQELENQLQGLQHAWQESQYNIAQYSAQIHQLQAAYEEQRMAERPLTPEGDLPGENPKIAAPSAPFRVPTFGTPEAGGLRSHSGSIRQAEARLRSSSLQSGNSSNYADFDDQDPAPPMPFRAAEAIREARKRSGGSNGGSSGSNSQRDPASPVVGVRDSPLGKKPLIWNP